MLFPLKSRCLQITTDVSKITKNVRRDLIFIFTEYSENTSTFAWIFLVAEINESVFKCCCFSKTSMLAHVQLCEIVLRHKYKCIQIVWQFNVVPLKFRKWEIEQHFTNAFYTKTRLSQGLLSDMELLEKLFPTI